MEVSTIIAIAVVAIIVFTIISIYNGIINRKNAVKRAWATVLTQERQKNKIIPELEKAVEKYTTFEEGLQSKITELRSAVNELSMDQPNPGELKKIEALSEKVMHGIKVTMEAYPDLKASELFSNLMQEVTEQQEHIGAAIRIFNYNVEAFNNGIQNFPNNMVNSVLNKEKEIDTFTDSEASKGFEYTPNL
ncbi:LemA family protein [Marinobacter sp. MBR-105]|jgi:LemA protein